MAHPWPLPGKPTPSALFVKRLGKWNSQSREECPEIRQLGNGDIAVISRDLTAVYGSRLPEGVTLGVGERLVVLPGAKLSAAKPDIRSADDVGFAGPYRRADRRLPSGHGLRSGT
ncbi:hypothetical protein [Embleya scabrispora]|uniref:hypothetical protein n=1 Tax=Embleya scabrispora TaxID=159449 RepID=UPI00037FB392